MAKLYLPDKIRMQKAQEALKTINGKLLTIVYRGILQNRGNEAINAEIKLKMRSALPDDEITKMREAFTTLENNADTAPKMAKIRARILKT